MLAPTEVAEPVRLFVALNEANHTRVSNRKELNLSWSFASLFDVDDEEVKLLA